MLKFNGSVIFKWQVTLVVIAAISGLALMPENGITQETNISPHQMSLFIPKHVPGIPWLYSTNSYSKRHDLNGWLNTNADVKVTAVRVVPATYQATRPFTVMKRLLQAYRNADVDAVEGLYDANSRPMIARVLSPSDTKRRWASSVTNIQAFVPLVIWKETNCNCMLTWAICNPIGTNATQKMLFPLLFNTNFDLIVGRMDSAPANDLAIYFADGSRAPRDLFNPTNPAPVATSSVAPDK
jgi:hypothetical protein